MRVQLTLHATKLKNIEKEFRKGKSDPYAIITLDGGDELGRTETIDNCLNPDWTKIFFMDIKEDICVPITVEIFDQNENREDGHMGTANFELWEVFRNDVNLVGEDLGQGATLYLRVEKSQRGNVTGNVRLQLRALDLANVESGLFGTGKSDPFFEICKKCSYPEKGYVYWQHVYRSEHKKNMLNPLWEDPVFLSAEALCYGDLNWPLRISFYDHNKHRKHQWMGTTYTTAKDLLESVAVKGNADRDKALILRSGEIENSPSTGLIVVLKAELCD